MYFNHCVRVYSVGIQHNNGKGNLLGILSSHIGHYHEYSQRCNLDDFARELRKCLDAVFLYSKNIEFESDKVNYMLSTVFFLASWLSKATIGLTEFDHSINKIEQIGKS